MALRGWLLPGIVSTDAPDVAFEVAAGEGSTAVVHVPDVEQHGGPGGLCGGVDGVGVADYEVGALGFAVTYLVGLDGELAVLAAVIDGAEHDHAGTEGELGVGDGIFGAHIDGLLLEAEGADEPVDGCEGVAVAEGGNDGFGLILHGDIVLHHGAVRPGKNGSLRVNFCGADGHPPPYVWGVFCA